MKKTLFILLYHFSKLNKVKIKNIKSVFVLLNFLLTISTVNTFEYWHRLAPVPRDIKLGIDCKSSLQCLLNIPHSQCSWDDRKCECQKYFLNSNNTRCLPGVLLTFECEIDAQCELKVPNSECSNNKCVCKENHIKIRLDKCLPPATIGDYCLNDEMCSSTDIYSHCKWVIPRAYGKCKCLPDHFYAQDKRCYPKIGQQCFKNNDCQKGTKYSKCGNMSDQKNTMIVVKASVRKHNKNKILNKSKYSNRNSRLMYPFKSDNSILPKLTNTAKTGYRSISRQSRLTKKFKNNQILNTCRCISGYIENDNKTNCIKIESKKTLQLSTQLSSILSPMASANNINEQYIIKRRPIDQSLFNSSSLMPISIGKKCNSSLECKLRDQYSECTEEGICDCQNRNSKCSIQNTGCYDGTFQCNDGSCLSWYFVCNGHRDCIDNSDETACIRYNCPIQAFQCENGYCISKGKLCNQIDDCADGSDEKGCDIFKDKNNVCPLNTFQCRSDKKCLPSYTFCNNIPECTDGSDEDPNICELNQVCPTNSFQCKTSKKCRSTAITCSGVDGCEDGSDEEFCSVCYCDRN